MGASTRISYYTNQRAKQADSDIDIFIDQIITGTWQDAVSLVRTAKDKDEKKHYKDLLPGVTVSGYFPKNRKAAELASHSGFISLDFDDLGDKIQGYKQLLKQDPYVYAVFYSCSGKGLCAIVPIDGTKHLEAFLGLAQYTYEKYGLIIDPSGKDVSRLRYVSFDPDVSINKKALKFKQYPKANKPQKELKTVFVKTDFNDMVKALANKNICENYNDWISVGYALADHFREGGRDYYHLLSFPATKYDRDNCDKQYDAILKTLGDKPVMATISKIYSYALKNGIQLYSQETKEILRSTTIQQKSGMGVAGIVSTLQKFEGIDPSVSQPIVEQAIANNVTIEGEDSIITLVEGWLRYNHSIKRNGITRKLENHGVPVQEAQLNTLFLSCKKAFDEITFDLFCKILFSESTDEYNPLIDFFQSYHSRQPIGVIDDFWKCFKTESHVLSILGTKWLVGLISAIHGQHSPLMLILCGGQNSGKTEAFRRLLPKELKQYYAESKLDAGKDDEILMCQKLLIMDDEMGGKSKSESKRLKDLTSKQTFSLRVPYGRGNEDLNRLAVLCGTTNDLEILNDATGNRRMIVSEIISIDHDAYNQIDKIDLLMEAYWLWKSGFEWQLKAADIDFMERNSQKFEDYTMEYELIHRYLLLPESARSAHEWSCTEIKVHLEQKSNQKIIMKRLGAELKRSGFTRLAKKVNGKTVWVYRVLLNTTDSNQYTTNETIF